MAPSSLVAASLLLVLLGTSAPAAATATSCPWDPAAPLAARRQPACPAAGEQMTMTFSPWTPWTYVPFCADTEWCVYSNALFQNGRGVSIIARPDAVKEAAPLLHGAFTFPAQERVPAPGEEGCPYEVQDLPGKGKGVVATRFIRHGEIFMLDYAAVFVDVKFPTRVRQASGMAMMEKAVEQLPEPERVTELGRSSTKGAPLVEDVLRTNTFNAKLDGKEYMGLFPVISVSLSGSFVRACGGGVVVSADEDERE
jgi:hypothetical protein